MLRHAAPRLQSTVPWASDAPVWGQAPGLSDLQHSVGVSLLGVSGVLPCS